MASLSSSGIGNRLNFIPFWEAKEGNEKNPDLVGVLYAVEGIQTGFGV
jgi:hypothetical protein